MINMLDKIKESFKKSITVEDNEVYISNIFKYEVFNILLENDKDFVKKCLKDHNWDDFKERWKKYE